MNRQSLLRWATVVGAWVTLVSWPATAWSLINPSLQPVDLFQRYKVTVIGTVRSADVEKGEVKISIARSFGPEFAPKEVTVVAGEGMKGVLRDLVDAGTLHKGAAVVAYVGSTRRRGEKDFILYWDAWALGKVESLDKPDRWLWETDDRQESGTDEKAVPSMGGTWNGSAEQLARMMEDAAAGRAHFPRKAYARFRPDVLLDRFDKPVRGVALYDIDGDGRLDVYACSPGGDRAYLQTQPLEFADATERLGLKGVAGDSCSFADVNADGVPDLLAGGVVFLGNKGGFRRADVLPAKAGENLKVAAFADINGDGYPDVVASKLKGGLELYLNPGAAGGKFTEATKGAGLDARKCGAGGDGFFAVGDWNGDGRCDLFYAAGAGLLLVQDARGAFAPLETDIEFSFESGQKGEPGLTGAGCFAPLLVPDRLDLVVPNESGWMVIGNRDGKMEDVTGYGNEITEGSFLHLATIAEDLNADGHVDLFTVSRAAAGQNRFIINRGYGSFMNAVTHRNYGDMFQGPALDRGGWGVAAGDVDGDGAPDLLVGNCHGELVLVINETLQVRQQPDEHPTDDIKRLQGVRMLTVRVAGKLGVLGATVKLSDAAGRCVARRDIGLNVASGCRGPDTVSLAVREAGQYVLSVRYSDGKTLTRKVDLGKGGGKVDVNRDKPEAP